MIILYGAYTSPNVMKVRILLEETGIPYEGRNVRRDLDENRTPEFLRINPTGTIPAMVDEDTGARLFESSAMLLYLAEKSGRFLPQNPAHRGDVLKWLMYEATDVSPVFETIYEYYYQEADWIAGALAFQQQKLRERIAILEARLGEAEFLAGDCSIADFSLVTIVGMLEDFIESPLTDYPNLQRWLQALGQRPGVQRARRLDQG